MGNPIYERTRQMKTFNKKSCIIGLLLYVIPLTIILFTYNNLPASIPRHWDVNGEVDGWMDKSFIYIEVFGMLAFHLVLLFIQRILPDKHGTKNSKLANLMFYYFMPVLTTIIVGASILSIYSKPQIISTIVFIFIGLLFMVIGNYLPKVRHNYWLGIKLPWTLASTVNWEKTHRFAGPIWVISGLFIVILGIISIFLDSDVSVFIIIMLIIIFADVLIPSIYSYKQYKIESNN